MTAQSKRISDWAQSWDGCWWAYRPFTFRLVTVRWAVRRAARAMRLFSKAAAGAAASCDDFRRASAELLEKADQELGPS